MDNRFFINPGSASGAWSGALNGYVVCTIHVPFLTSLSPWCSDPVPSFALLDIQGPIVVTYVYQLIDGEVRVEKIEWRKEQENPVPKSATPLQSYESTAVSSAVGASGW
jgi:vacuolar protein sorting-associated protein 29